MNTMQRLVGAVQQLSLARSVDDVARVVRTTAREITGADGATFVLRDFDLCYYADEDAIAPLWKGSRFPMTACVSGWVMNHAERIVIPDVFADPRVPVDAYRPTFVRSMAMVPIRQSSPIGAIGNYWARHHIPTRDDLELLQALADSTSIALDNVQLYQELERRVADRTAELSAANRELESFSYSVSHDLRAPLRTLDGFSGILREEYSDKLDDRGRDYLDRLQRAATHMNELIESLLELARVVRTGVERRQVDVSELARELTAGLPVLGATRPEVVIQRGLVADADPRLMRSLLGNLVENAWKYSARSEAPRIEIGREQRDGRDWFFVRDNGVGFDMRHADKLFEPFVRLHATKDYQGSGIGLATVQRIVDKHGGDVFAESAPGAGAVFYFRMMP